MAITTITTTASEDTRLAAAVQRATGLGSPANAAQCKAFVISMMRQFVQQQEHIVQLQALNDTPFDPT